MSDSIKLVEAILFAAGKPISLSRICELTELPQKKVIEILEGLQQKYNDQQTAFQLVQMGTEWKMTVANEYLSIAEKITPDTELTKTVIETLAIIAWKSPVLQSDIVKIRSTKAYDHVGELKDKGFIEKQKVGRSSILKLTPKFYEYFDLQGKEEIQKMFAEQEEIIAQKKVTDVFDKELEEQKKREAEIAAHEALSMEEKLHVEGPSLHEIKSKEREAQKEFLAKLEENLSSTAKRAQETVSEIKEMAPAQVEEKKEESSGETVSQEPESHSEEPKKEI